ncbi:MULTISPECIES: toll/interleukin-1 receptor domain-containing protein [unclassified Streptomyces]|uniref:toll/interleukin-1 receptor domain-containing protein n=1 Tax=unclassified Streptomyces TaxID=2593676 RepID=UPI002366BAEE|nr:MULTISPECIES: toll/interleukin-1 receptor domain-containing protein [unclassified Streptomyces]MDF3141984.1 toll/interleukin-1 receptor domain-containing protein [Streptomyces sp. T21Q-yed]WDF36680.1 toll/interleukin-1 receptor domain-containing protein [Streptomyces sp. T12]
MPEIFINYRTGDGEQVAATLDNALRTRFGDDHVYRASRSIAPGDLFDSDLITNVRNSSVLLALIGDRWLDKPTLGTDEDWVTKEILEAFRHDIRVIPVLIGRRTERPAKRDLPDSLLWLTDCQTLRYDHQTDERDLKHIGDALADLVPSLAAADRTVQEPDAPAATGNSTGDLNNSWVVHTGQVTGGAIHIGPDESRHSHHTVHQNGTGANYVAGDNHGGIRQSFGATPPAEDGE